MLVTLKCVWAVIGLLALAPCSVFAAEGDVIADVVYGHKMGMALTFDVLKPEKNDNGTGVLFMVSGGWVSTWFPPEEVTKGFDKALGNLFTKLLDKGFTVFLVRHGSSPLFKVPDAVEDVRLTVRHIRLNAEKFGIDPDRLGVFGGSAGGHLSLMLGTTGDDGDPEAKTELERTGNRVQAVAAYYPPTDLTNYLNDDRFPALHFEANLVDAVSPIRHVTPDDAPTLLVHGDRDTLVPDSHSKEIQTVFEEAEVPSKLIIIEKAGHGFMGSDGQKASDALVSWFEEHLLPKEK